MMSQAFCWLVTGFYSFLIHIDMCIYLQCVYLYKAS